MSAMGNYPWLAVCRLNCFLFFYFLFLFIYLLYVLSNPLTWKLADLPWIIKLILLNIIELIENSLQFSGILGFTRLPPLRLFLRFLIPKQFKRLSTSPNLEDIGALLVYILCGILVHHSSLAVADSPVKFSQQWSDIQVVFRITMRAWVFQNVHTYL